MLTTFVNGGFIIALGKKVVQNIKCELHFWICVHVVGKIFRWFGGIQKNNGTFLMSTETFQLCLKSLCTHCP